MLETPSFDKLTVSEAAQVLAEKAASFRSTPRRLAAGLAKQAGIKDTVAKWWGAQNPHLQNAAIGAGIGGAGGLLMSAIKRDDEEERKPWHSMLGGALAGGAVGGGYSLARKYIDDVTKENDQAKDAAKAQKIQDAIAASKSLPRKGLDVVGDVLKAAPQDIIAGTAGAIGLPAGIRKLDAMRANLLNTRTITDHRAMINALTAAKTPGEDLLAQITGSPAAVTEDLKNVQKTLYGARHGAPVPLAPSERPQIPALDGETQAAFTRAGIPVPRSLRQVQPTHDELRAGIASRAKAQQLVEDLAKSEAPEVRGLFGGNIAGAVRTGAKNLATAEKPVVTAPLRNLFGGEIENVLTKAKPSKYGWRGTGGSLVGGIGGLIASSLFKPDAGPSAESRAWLEQYLAQNAPK